VKVMLVKTWKKERSVSLLLFSPDVCILPEDSPGPLKTGEIENSQQNE
jgi:hypothetical protein